MLANFLSALCRLFRAVPMVLVVGFGLQGCENPRNTIDRLEQQISAYAENPTPAAAAEINATFATLDEEIARLRAQGKTAEANQLASQRTGLEARFDAAKLAGTFLKARQALENVGETVREVGQQIGDSIREATQPAPSPND